MRTTLSIDDDVLAAAREMAAIEGKSVGTVISQLARRALMCSVSARKARNGIPLLPVGRGGSLVTSELVRRLSNDLIG